ncbi:MAG: relaxase/mobilization nuclease domain-containing protein [Bacteroidia bacterium]|nr:relaxase/mobilization nuclease domain-containing protein [Bacteroidia bacterium]
MVIKSLSIKSKAGIKSLLGYLLKDQQRLHNGEGEIVRVSQHLRSESIEGISREMLMNDRLFRQHERANSVSAYHEILAFSPQDAEQITPKILEDLTREYLKMRAPDSQAIAVAHFEKDHMHVHLAFAGVMYRDGRSSRINRREFAQLKEEMQRLQMERYPQLSNSLVKHGGKEPRQSEKEILKGVVEQQIKAIISETKNVEEFKQAIEDLGMTLNYRGDKSASILVDDQKYMLRNLGIPSLREAFGDQETSDAKKKKGEKEQELPMEANITKRGQDEDHEGKVAETEESKLPEAEHEAVQENDQALSEEELLLSEYQEAIRAREDEAERAERSVAERDEMEERE